jgi:DNA helicase-2/ATP-dependent DNA helicase PcrA
MLAFNRVVAEDWNTKRQTVGVNRRSTAQTFHSFAYRAYKQAKPEVERITPSQKAALVPDLRLVNEADSKLYIALIEAMQQEAYGISSTTISLTSLRRLLKSRPNLPFPFVENEKPQDLEARTDAMLERVPRLFKQWNDLNCQYVTYCDTLYAPVAEGSFKSSYDVVACDEAQDTNAIRRLIVGQAMKARGQLIFCGDQHQAIYAFDGADTDSMNQIMRGYATRELHLSTSYRCAHAIAAEARKIAPHLTAYEKNPNGTVVHEDFKAFVRRKDLRADDAVLCRNNAPLANIALHLLKEKIPCRVLGTEIGTQLKATVTGTPATSLRALRSELCRRVELAADAGYGHAFVDRAYSAIALIDGLPGGTLADLHQVIDAMFPNEGAGHGVTLSTIHKAKGREWDRVFLVGNEKYLDLDADGSEISTREQEKNLLYVGITRARRYLSFVTAPEAEFHI